MKLIKDLGLQYATKKSKTKVHFGIFECPMCKEHFRTHRWSGLNDKTTKCMPCASRLRNTTHGASGERLYSIWIGMKRRCLNTKHKHYKKYYGGKGIKIYSEWVADYFIFKKWALLNGYSNNLTIDRVDGEGNYEPSNCRWVSRKVQSRNTPKLSKHNTSGYRGVCFDKQRNKWVVHICVNGTQKYLGRFQYPWTAAYAYDSYILVNNLEHTRNYELKEK